MDPIPDRALYDFNWLLGLLRDGVITHDEWRNEVSFLRAVPISKASVTAPKSIPTPPVLPKPIPAPCVPAPALPPKKAQATYEEMEAYLEFLGIIGNTSENVTSEAVEKNVNLLH